MQMPGGQRGVGSLGIAAAAAVVAGALLPPIPALAEIATPSFTALVASADIIAEGTVRFIYPAPSYWLPILIYGLGLAIVAVILKQSHRRGAKATAVTAVPFFILGLVLAFLVGPGFRGYRWVAVLSVSEVLKGSNESKMLHIHYPGHTTDDMSRFERGKRYVVFLRHSDNWYPLLDRPRLVPCSYDWGIWEVTPQGAITQRFRWDGVPPKPLIEFKQAIRALMENPDHPEYARIWELEDGRPPRYYPIKYDPFFNPKVRAKLEERERAAEGDAAESDDK